MMSQRAGTGGRSSSGRHTAVNLIGRVDEWIAMWLSRFTASSCLSIRSAPAGDDLTPHLHTCRRGPAGGAEAASSSEGESSGEEEDEEDEDALAARRGAVKARQVVVTCHMDDRIRYCSCLADRLPCEDDQALTTLW